MATLTIVVGLPGSGKSHLIRTYETTHPGAFVVDDYHAGAPDGSAAVTAGRAYPALITALRGGRDGLVADVAFTDTWRREELARVVRSDVRGVVLAWVYFENDLAACLANIHQRDRDSRDEEEELARYYAPRYFVPEDATAVPVWRPPA